MGTLDIPKWNIKGYKPNLVGKFPLCFHTIVVTLSGMVTLISRLCLNARNPILVTPWGITTAIRKFPTNTSFSITLIFSEIVTLSRWLLLNAALPKTVTLLGMIRLLKSAGVWRGCSPLLRRI